MTNELRPRHYADAIARGTMTLDSVPADMRSTVKAHLDDAALRETGRIVVHINKIASMATREERLYALAKLPEHMRDLVRAAVIAKFEAKKNANSKSG